MDPVDEQEMYQPCSSWHCDPSAKIQAFNIQNTFKLEICLQNKKKCSHFGSVIQTSVRKKNGIGRWPFYCCVCKVDACRMIFLLWIDYIWDYLNIAQPTLWLLSWLTDGWFHAILLLGTGKSNCRTILKRIEPCQGLKTKPSN